MRIASAPASVTAFLNCSTFDIVASRPLFLCCTPQRAALSKPHGILLPNPDNGHSWLSFRDSEPLLQWQQLAAVREEVFEQALVEPGAAPSASGIIARHDAVTRPQCRDG